MRRAALLVVALLVASTGAAVVAAQEAQVTVSGVEVSPEPAFVGETVTVAPTILNQQASPTSVDVEAVRLHGLPDGARGRTSATQLGTLTPGSSVRVPFDLTFGGAGSKRFRVEVFGEDGNGNNVHLVYPVTVQVRNDHPLVSVRGDASLVAGVSERVNVSVANGFEREIRSVDVTFSGSEVDARPISDAAARIEAGTASRFAFEVRSDRSGTFDAEVTVRYRTTTGLERTAVVERQLAFEPLREDVSFDAAVPPDGQLGVPVVIGNFGNAPLERVVVRGSATNGTVAPVAVGTVPPGTTRRVVVNLSDVGTRADVSLRATYEVGPNRRSASTESRVVAPPAVPGRIELTGLNVEREDGALHVTGSASNVGLRKVDSVVVRVRETASVRGVAPNREYFVGTIPPSDFVSFDVYATVDGNVSEIPLTVTYLADGQRRTHEASVPYDASPEPVDTGSSGGPGLVVYLVGAVVALAVVGLIVVGWRNRGE